jgi:DNA-binding NarL/FixJ family response regulator
MAETTELTPIKLVIVASVPALRLGLKSIFDNNSRFLVISESADIPARVILTNQVDLLVLVAWELSPAELQKIILDIDPSIATLFLSNESIPVQLLNQLKRRVWGILPVESTREELIAAAYALVNGLWVGDPQLLGSITGNQARPTRLDDDSIIEPLTPRETEILQFLAQGFTNKQIAWKLSISEHTVKFHISSIYGKLGAANRTEAVRLGARSGIIVI